MFCIHVSNYHFQPVHANLKKVQFIIIDVLSDRYVGHYRPELTARTVVCVVLYTQCVVTFKAALPLTYRQVWLL